MSSTWGKNLRLTLFGESHGNGIGIVIDGLPPGMVISWQAVRREMARRAPGRDEFSTPRREEDDFQILSGFFQERTTGTPLTAVIFNQDRQSADYERMKDILRPGHADYSGFIKYKGFNDYRGGGHFSGRLTAPIVFAGALAKQFLAQKDIIAAAYIRSIGDIREEALDPVHPDIQRLLAVHQKDFPALNEKTGVRMKEAIAAARAEQDSLGGVVETYVLHLPPGLGDPFFDSVESCLAQFLFSIPAVKGVEFGAGFAITGMKGSQANDPYHLAAGEVRTLSNHNGGIIGGITNGMPLVFRTAFKPTPSIGKEQRSIDKSKMAETILQISGRHDPCIVPRAVPVVEAAAALVITDLLLKGE